MWKLLAENTANIDKKVILWNGNKPNKWLKRVFALTMCLPCAKGGVTACRDGGIVKVTILQ